ncbi:hypothetical protein Tco_1146685, partial [Tanacetum coccineum]
LDNVSAGQLIVLAGRTICPASSTLFLLLVQCSYWVLNSPCYRNKELASPEQTAPDSPLPEVHTPWDVMRIVCNPALMYLIVIVAEVVPNED